MLTRADAAAKSRWPARMWWRARHRGNNAGVPSHLVLLSQMLALLGCRPVPRRMFPYPWPSRKARLARMIHASGRLLLPMMRRRSRIVVFGPELDRLRGMISITQDSGIGAMIAAIVQKDALIVTASRETNPVHNLCRRLGLEPTDRLAAYLSVNTLLVFLGTRAGRPVVIHIATDPDSQRSLERHRQGLVAARSADAPAAFRALLPELLDMTCGAATPALVQTRLPGSCPRFNGSDERPLVSAIMAAAQPLLLLSDYCTRPDGGADRDLLWSDLPRIAAARPELWEYAAPLLDYLRGWQRRGRLPAVLTHGDYWLRNVLFDSTGSEVLGIVDWDRCRPDGCFGYDAVYLVVLTLAMERHRPVERSLCQIWSGQYTDNLLAELLGFVRTAFVLTTADVEHLALMIYLHEFLKLTSNNDPLTPKHFASLVVSPAPILRSWMALNQAA